MILKSVGPALLYRTEWEFCSLKWMINLLSGPISCERPHIFNNLYTTRRNCGPGRESELLVCYWLNIRFLLPILYNLPWLILVSIDTFSPSDHVIIAPNEKATTGIPTRSLPLSRSSKLHICRCRRNRTKPCKNFTWQVDRNREFKGSGRWRNCKKNLFYSDGILTNNLVGAERKNKAFSFIFRIRRIKKK